METGWRRNYLRYKSFFLNMMTQYHERSDWRVYLEILLSLATISIFSTFALRPTILTIAELIKQIEEKKSTVATMDQKIQNLGKAQTLYDRESANISLLTNYAIPSTPNSDVFARQIEGLSSKHKVAITSLTVGEGTLKGTRKIVKTDRKENNDNTETTDLSEASFTLIASASVEEFNSIINFAKDFENLRITPLISTLELSLKDTDLNNKLLILLIEGSLPYVPNNLINLNN